MNQQTANGDGRIVGRLSLVVTEQCNLHCTYCYARPWQGRHQSRTMSIAVANAVLDKIIARVGRCEFIQFFGGEPTLNIDLVEHLARELEHRCRSKELCLMPRLGIVTNGNFLHRGRVLEVLKRYGIEPTISLDGPPAIHNRLRPSRTGAPTYDEVAESIRELNSLDLPVALETVYTAYHIARQYSIIDCIEFAKQHGVSKLIFQSAYPPATDEISPLSDACFEAFLQHYMQAVDWWFGGVLRNGEVFDIYFKDLLKIMLYDPSAQGPGCPAGIANYSISPDGTVYPCQLLYGKPELRLGNVTKKDFVLPHKAIKAIHTEFEECRSCFARHWCQPCAALNDFFGDMAHPQKRECAVRKAVILRIAQWAAQCLKLPQNPHSTILLERINALSEDFRGGYPLGRVS